MSGIYIPGIETSETCALCRFCDGIADTQLGACAFCVVDGKARRADTTPKDCPLVPVPDHGRLGDLDELYVHLNEWYLTHRGGMNPTEALYIRAMLAGIKDAPTIIPADKEGEG